MCELILYPSISIWMFKQLQMSRLCLNVQVNYLYQGNTIIYVLSFVIEIHIF